MNLKITEEKALVTFDGDFSISELKEAKEIMKEIEEKNIVKIMFDFRNVRYIDSSAIGMLVTVLKYTRKNQGVFKIYSPGEEVKRILRLVNLDSFFEIIEGKTE
jgi:anti-anti-sigma factor